MTVRQYVISEPLIIKFSQSIKDTNGTPTVVWQQQMEKAYISTYKVVHNDRPDRYYAMDYTNDFETQFRPLQTVEDYNPQNVDPEYSMDLYWDEDLYDKTTLQCKCDDYLPTDDADDPVIGPNKISRALI